jgi:proteasome lid subunit RPN8/RPN11
MSDSQLWLDFSEFAEITHLETKHTKQKLRPRDFPFETAYNDPPANTILSILFNKIELNKYHVPTKRGWKNLNNLLAMYRSKQYETVRYLLLDKSGDIVDHVAITNYLPDRAKIAPDSIPQGKYFKKLAEYVSRNDYKIIMVHNHPSGEVEPSDQDLQITGYCRRV